MFQTLSGELGKRVGCRQGHPPVILAVFSEDPAFSPLLPGFMRGA